MDPLQSRLAAEQRARVLIDAQLEAAGWSVQDRKDLNLVHHTGVAVRESIMAPGHGRADYLLYVNRQAVGVIEAKPIGTPLSGVEWQSAMYAEGLPAEVRLKALTLDGRLPFVFEASGSETHMTNGYDPVPRARRIFAVPTPATLARIVREAEMDPLGLDRIYLQAKRYAPDQSVQRPTIQGFVGALMGAQAIAASSSPQAPSRRARAPRRSGSMPASSSSTASASPS